MPRPCTLHAAAQLQPIHALCLACGAQRALLPVAVGAMNIHDVRERRRQTDVRQTSDVRQHHCLMHPPRGRGIIKVRCQLRLRYSIVV